jgi:2-amino-4-hydroxy-6-hydroxymethyldihydropteridine diphosphokinase
MHTSELTIPHVGICERPFVIFPLLEIAPEVEIPGIGKGHQCIEHMDPASITQL